MITIFILFLLFSVVGLFSMAYAVFTGDEIKAEWIMEKSFAIAGFLLALMFLKGIFFLINTW